jgi:hypothetical protein
MADPTPIHEQKFTRRPSDAELTNIARQLGITTPILATRVAGGRLELYLLGGLGLTVGKGLDEPQVVHLAAEPETEDTP